MAETVLDGTTTTATMKIPQGQNGVISIANHTGAGLTIALDVSPDEDDGDAGEDAWISDVSFKLVKDGTAAATLAAVGIGYIEAIALIKRARVRRTAGTGRASIEFQKG